MRSLITYLGHSSFSIRWNEGDILIDPFFDEKEDFFKNLKITHIFLTHGHGDHVGISLDLYKNINQNLYVPMNCHYF